MTTRNFGFIFNHLRKNAKYIDSVNILSRPIYFFSTDTSLHSNIALNQSNGKQTKVFCSFFHILITSTTTKDVAKTRVEFKSGHAKLILMLPAKQEFCEFNLKLLNQTIGELIEQIKLEDKSIEKVLFYSNGKSSYLMFKYLLWKYK